jgi:dTDP-4-amino-4,6-dideoxygalactose transaminase
VAEFLPFFPPDLFDSDRELLVELVREIGTAPDQKFILGPYTELFEALLCESTGSAHAITCGSGTSALTMVLRALDVGPGDEVVVPAFGCAPLAAAVLALDARPVFADIEPHRMTMDPDLVEPLLTPRTKAVVPAHMFSIMADMPRFLAVAQRHGLRLAEDSAVAQGAVLRGRPAGTWGEAGLFSFVQVKSFGMPGEGGAVITSDDGIAERIRRLRNHGQTARFRHAEIGWNSRFDELQAAFQVHRFPGLSARLARRAQIADYYSERFSALPGILPPPPDRDGRCHYVYCLLAERRDELKEHLAANGIAGHVYYPSPLPLQAAFAPHADPRGRWPRAEAASARILAIPVYPHLTDAQVERIADTVCAFTPSRPRSRA